MFSKDWSPFSKDPWWLDENQKIINSSYKRGKRLVDFNNEEKIRLLSKLKIYVSELHFDDMPPEIEKRYREGKEAGGYTDMEEQMSSQKAGKKDDVWKGRVMASINLLAEAGISREKVLTELGMSNDDLRTTMHDVKAINPNVIVRYPKITKKVTPSKTNI